MKAFVLPILFFLVLCFAPITIEGQAKPVETPAKAEAIIDLNKTATSSSPLQIVVLLTLLSFVPAILISMTCFTRLIVVFHFLRQALGTQEAPNNQILLGLALFITLFVMTPTLKQVYDTAYKPLTDGEISQSEALEKGLVPLRAYMIKHTREKDLMLFLQLSRAARPNTADDVPTTALIPAYMISELKTAFQTA